MPDLTPTRRWSRRAGAAVLAAVALALAGCGDDDDAPVGAASPTTSATSVGGTDGAATTGGASGSTPVRPEDVIAPIAEVRIKLPGLVTLGNAARDQAAAGDWDGAADTFENLENLWFEVEGTVGDADRDIYERAETAQGLINDGIDAEKPDRVATGAAAQAAAIQDFLDAHPA